MEEARRIAFGGSERKKVSGQNYQNHSHMSLLYPSRLSHWMGHCSRSLVSYLEVQVTSELRPNAGMRRLRE